MRNTSAGYWHDWAIMDMYRVIHAKYTGTAASTHDACVFTSYKPDQYCLLGLAVVRVLGGVTQI